MSSPRNEWVQIGVIARAHGVRGQVRVRLSDQASTALTGVKSICLGAPDKRVGVRGIEEDAMGYRLLLEGIVDRNQADLLRGLPIFMERSSLPELEEDEVYVHDLVGCTVEDTAGKALGVVREVQNGGAQELLVLDGGALVPLVDGIVQSVDLEGRRIVCDPPEGLLEINDK